MIKEKNKIKDLTQGKISKQIITLAAPIIGTSFIHVVYSFTDMAWIGRLGSREIAAVGVVAVLVWLTSSIGSIVKVGSEVCVAQGLGAHNEELARSYAKHNSTLALYFSLGIMVLCQLFAHKIIALYALEDDISTMAEHYLQIVSLGFPFFFLSLCYGGIYTAAGRSNVPFAINSLGLITNILLDPLFIFVLDYGVEGAAWATVLSEFLVFSVFFYRIKIKEQLLGKWGIAGRLHYKETKKILTLGLPVALLNSLFALITLTMGSIASRTGGHIGVATINTGGQLEAITWNTSQGFGTALAAFVGQNYAARKYKRIFKAFKVCIIFTSIFGLIATFLYYFWGEEFFALIVPDPEAYTEGGNYLRIAAYSQLFMMAEITIQGLFYGTGRSVTPASISIAGNLLRIPLAFLFLSWGWQLNGVWWAISLTSMLKGTIAIATLPYIKGKIKLLSNSTSE
ncbi:MATE family efflux transporter [Porphyromonas circumdentaria]|uniref:MATE family efflux transporter n=1 Tax=Porphyromonas circumdentaria TaxID=29524 RepID=UPI0026DC7421|nr:MATE family efflux transporter [Porphyromonas circumdentaria]MDO4721908.1 MATE family efflux transporter [Porphyromonas circumdentaria]